MRGYLIRSLLLFCFAFLTGVFIVGLYQYFSFDRDRSRAQVSSLETYNERFQKQINATLKEQFRTIDFLTSTSYPRVAIEFSIYQPFHTLVADQALATHIDGTILLDAKANLLSSENVDEPTLSALTKLTAEQLTAELFYYNEQIIYFRCIHLNNTNLILGFFGGTQSLQTVLNQLRSSYLSQTENLNHLQPTVDIAPSFLASVKKDALTPLDDEIPLEFSYEQPTPRLRTFFAQNVSVFFISAIILVLFTFLLQRNLKRPIKRLLAVIAFTSNQEESEYPGPMPRDPLFRTIARRILENHRARVHLEQQAREQAVQNKLAEVAKSVAHDIRSPLAVLNMLATSIKSIPEDRRIVLRSALGRINDIANDLLQKNTEAISAEQQATTLDVAADDQDHLLPSLVDAIVSEKRIQYRSRADVNIEFIVDQDSYGLFAKVNGRDFKRVISNLIDNSMEAIQDPGHVQVHLFPNNNNVSIVIEDDGSGIDKEALEHLKEASFNYRKVAGAGLGLYTTYSLVKSWGGEFKLESEPQVGTKAQITLPQRPAPKWFVPELRLCSECKVVTLDDDPTIHEIWRERITNLTLSRQKEITLVNFSNARNFKAWSKTQDLSKMLFLIDYELLGQNTTGLNLIRELNIAKQSILVTSRYDDSAVREQVTKLGISILPKGMAEYVPIATEDSNEGNSNPDGILIDDDPLIRNSWAISAESNGLNLWTFGDVGKFLDVSKRLAKDTPIYIDYNLEGGIRGDNVAKDLHDIGFTKIFLATGFPVKTKEKMPWLNLIQDKLPPWVS